MGFRYKTYILLLGVVVTIMTVVTTGSVMAAGSGTSLTTSPVTLGLNIHPGSSSTQTLEVMNNTAQPLPIVMQLKTFGAFGATGDAAITDFLPGNPAASWVKFSPKSFTAQPGVWSKVQATIAIPKSALLGYYYAVIFQPITPTQPLAPKTTAVKGSNAILILLDTGSANEQRQAEVSSFSVDRGMYEYLPAKLSVTVQNSGNIYLAPTGDIFISRHQNGSNTIGTLVVNGGGGNVLPNSKRVFQASWTDGFPVYQPVTKDGKQSQQLHWDFSKTNKLRIGKYYARLALVYNNGSHQVLLNSTVSFWVIPWKILLVVLAFVLLILFGVWSLGRGIYRRFRKLRTTKTKVVDS